MVIVTIVRTVRKERSLRPFEAWSGCAMCSLRVKRHCRRNEAKGDQCERIGLPMRVSHLCAILAAARTRRGPEISWSVTPAPQARNTVRERLTTEIERSWTSERVAV